MYFKYFIKKKKKIVYDTAVTTVLSRFFLSNKTRDEDASILNVTTISEKTSGMRATFKGPVIGRQNSEKEIGEKITRFSHVVSERKNNKNNQIITETLTLTLSTKTIFNSSVGLKILSRVLNRFRTFDVSDIKIVNLSYIYIYSNAIKAAKFFSNAYVLFLCERR